MKWAGLRPTLFVLVWAAWLAAPSQDDPHQHLFWVEQPHSQPLTMVRL